MIFSRIRRSFEVRTNGKLRRETREKIGGKIFRLRDECETVEKKMQSLSVYTSVSQSQRGLRARQVFNTFFFSSAEKQQKNTLLFCLFGRFSLLFDGYG